jgi:hypothetical protein
MQVVTLDATQEKSVDLNIKPNGATLSNCTQELGDIVLYDEFTSGSLGFNSSLWTYTTYGGPTMTWMDDEVLVLNSEMFTQVTLESTIETGPETVAEFDIRFSNGHSYFAIGWADETIDPVNEWVSNFRVCQNGVFIDYWDGELFLVTYSDGNRFVTELPEIDFTAQHHFSLMWGESLSQVITDL